MVIQLRNIKTFDEGGGDYFELPSNIIRFIEFEKTVVFWLDENGKRDKIVGVKFITSMEGGGVNHYYIAWEFQVVDGLGNIHEIDWLVKKIYDAQEIIECHGRRFDIIFYLNPNNGEIIDKKFTKW